MDVRLSLSGLLAPDKLAAFSKEKRGRVLKAIQDGMKDSRQSADRVMREEIDRAFDMRKVGAGKLRKSWRINVFADRGPAKMIIKNLAKWFLIHTTGGTIGPRTTPKAILIPINQRLGTRMGAKKFYAMIDWLRREKLTIIKDGVLYVKAPMNTSKRGGVAVGTRVQKTFRTKFQGSKRRPTGFDIKLNEDGLTPIAIIRTSIKMRKRFDLIGVAKNRVIPIVVSSINKRLMGEQFRL